MGTIEPSFIPRTTDISEETKAFLDEVRKETGMSKLKHPKFIDYMNIDTDYDWRNCDEIIIEKIVSFWYDDVTTFRLKCKTR